MNPVAALHKIVVPPRCGFCGHVLGTLPQCIWCGDVLPALALPDTPVTDILPHIYALDGAYACFDYRRPVRDAILEMKTPLGNARVSFYAGILAQKFAAVPLPAIDIVLAPPEYTAGKKRAYSHAAVLAQSFAAKAHLTMAEGVLQKCFATVPQKQLDAIQRRSNVLGVFRVENTAAVRGKTVLLVDDVLTTGATLDECAKMLRLAGAAAVYALCIAHAEDIATAQ